MTLHKKALFSLTVVIIFFVVAEGAARIARRIDLAPTEIHISPLDYIWAPAQYKVDQSGAPIWVDGFRTYHQSGIDPAPIKVNSAGFRFIDAHRFKSDSEKIGFFGDSYTEALQVSEENSFIRLSERELQVSGRPAALFNFAFGGQGPYHEYLRYKTIKRWVALDRAIMMFLPHNDLLNSHHEIGKPWMLPGAGMLDIEDGKFVEIHPTAGGDQRIFRERAKRIILENSVLISMLYQLLDQALEVYMARRNLSMKRALFGAFIKPASGEWIEAWKIVEETILRFRDEVEADGGRFTVVIVAGDPQTRPEQAPAIKLNPGESLDFSYPNTEMMRICRTHNIDCYDSLPYFLERKKELSPPYFSWEHDGHFSEVGHRTMADYLTENVFSNPASAPTTGTFASK